MKYNHSLTILLVLFGTVLQTVLARPMSKIRAAYMSEYDFKVLAPMKQAGMNAALVKFNHLYSPLTASQKESIKKWADGCDKYQIFIRLSTCGVWEKRKPFVPNTSFMMAGWSMARHLAL